MKYTIVDKQDYWKNKNKYITMIKELFKNDDSKIANIKEITSHLDYIFSKDITNDSMLILNIKNNRIISMINFLQYNNVENLWCLFSLFTLKSERKKGYGKDILKYGLEKVRKKQAKILISGIEEDNEESISLHKKIGFVYSGKNWDEIADGFPENHLGFIYEF